MSLISDVREEITGLDISKKGLRKFGFIVGTVFLLIALWFVFKNYSAALRYISGIAGAVLIVFAALFPTALRGIYKVWMGAAFFIGWIISRVLITILFFMVVTPVGLAGRLFGKKFLDLEIEKSKKSYWIKRDKTKKTNYEKMY